MHLMDSVEPTGYHQEMIDRWTAWEDEFMQCLLEEVGYAGFNEVQPKLNLWPFFSRGSEPEGVAASWANIYWAERRWTVPWMAGGLSDKEESDATRP